MILETEQEYQERLILIYEILDNNDYEFHQDFLDAREGFSKMRYAQLNRIRQLQNVQGVPIWNC
jgi:hypothetical protein